MVRIDHSRSELRLKDSLRREIERANALRADWFERKPDGSLSRAEREDALASDRMRYRSFDADVQSTIEALLECYQQLHQSKADWDKAKVQAKSESSFAAGRTKSYCKKRYAESRENLISAGAEFMERILFQADHLCADPWN